MTCVRNPETARQVPNGTLPALDCVASETLLPPFTESVIGLFKTEVIRRKGPWRSFEALEFSTLAWVGLARGGSGA